MPTLFNNGTAAISVSVGSTGSIAGNQGGTPVTLTTAASSRSKIAQLDDVNDLNPVDGGTLVYSASAQEYVLKNPDIDGGTF